MTIAAAGATVTLFAQYQDGTGTAVTPTTPQVAILSSLGAQVFTATPVTTGQTGRYSIDYDVPLAGPLGSWTAVWTGIINGAGVESSEVFTVVEAGDIVFPSPDEYAMQELRMRLDEVKALGDEDGSGTMFTDDFLADLVASVGGNYDKATYEGWKWKAARFSRLIDITESGSDRSLSQKFKQAEAMLKLWKGIVGDAAKESAEALAGRVVGKAVNLRCSRTESETPYPFQSSSYNIRAFPTHRLLIVPAIL